MTFPRLIHYIFWDFGAKNRPIPAEWIRNIHRNYDLGRKDGWHYQIWDQQNSFQLMRQCIEEYSQKRYLSIPERKWKAEQIFQNFLALPGVVQTDLVRVGIIYWKGGVYCDASDIILNKSLEDLVKNTNLREGGCHFHVEYFDPCLSLGNASFGAVSQHHVVGGLLDFLIAKLDVDYLVALKTQEAVYAFAGPKALTEYINKQYAICPRQLFQRTETHQVSVLGDGTVCIYPPKMLIGWGVSPTDAVFGIHAFKGSWKTEIPSEDDIRGRTLLQQKPQLRHCEQQGEPQREQSHHRMMIDDDLNDLIMVE